MATIRLDDAKDRLAELLARARLGETIEIAAEDGARVRLSPVAPEAAAAEPRRFGQLKGQLRIPDDFDAPVPDDTPPDRAPGLRPVGQLRGSLRVPDDFDAPLPDDVLDAFGARG